MIAPRPTNPPKGRGTREGKLPSVTSEIRLSNLRHLAGPERGGQRSLAEKLGMGEAQMSALLRKHKNIGSRLARKIEGHLGLPEGWMDSPHNDLTDEAQEFAREFQGLPTSAAPSETCSSSSNNAAK